MQNYPNHGPLACRVCWPNCQGADERSLDDDKFRIVNDPGYWGASDPEVLVLGQTKGFTQSEGMARAIQEGGYDAVAFKDFRPRLLQAMKAIYMMQNFKNLDRFMMDGETTFGWASVIRCSMTGRSSSGEYSSKSGCVLPAYHAREAGAVISACMNTWLRRLSDRTVLVVLLGNADDYIASFRAKLATTFSDTRAHQRGPAQAQRLHGLGADIAIDHVLRGTSCLAAGAGIANTHTATVFRLPALCFQRAEQRLTYRHFKRAA